jgi:hypothetical protein
MSLRQFHVIAIAAWFALVVAAIAASAWLGQPWSALAVTVGLGVACLPPLVFLAIFRGAPPDTIAQVLRDEEQRTAEVAERLGRITRGR